MTEKKFYLNDQPRQDLELTLPDGRVITGQRGAPLKDFVQVLHEPHALIVGGILDGHEGAHLPVKRRKFPPVTMQKRWARIYRRSLIFLPEVADLFPEAFVRPLGILAILPGGWQTRFHRGRLRRLETHAQPG